MQSFIREDSREVVDEVRARKRGRSPTESPEAPILIDRTMAIMDDALSQLDWTFRSIWG